MKAVWRWVAATCLLLAAVSCVHAEVLEGEVVGIQDGDTLTLLVDETVSYRIRLV